MIALPAIGLILVALMALLLLVAWPQISSAVQYLCSVSLPLVGSVLGNLIAGGVEKAYLFVAPWFDYFVTPIGDFMLRPVIAFENLFISYWSTMDSIYGMLYRLVHNSIPQGLAAVQAQALAWGNEAWQHADAIGASVTAQALAWAHEAWVHADDIGTAVTAQAFQWATEAWQHADAIGVSVTAQAFQWSTEAWNHADALYQQALAYVATEVTDLLGRLAQVAQVAAADTARALEDAEAFATAVSLQTARDLITDLEQVAVAESTLIWTDIDTGVLALEGVIATDLPDIMAGLRAIPRVLPTDIAGLLAGVSAISIPMLKFMEQCGIPNCKNLSALGRDLQALLGLVEGDAFLAMIIALARDPVSGARDVEDAMGGIVQGTFTAARDLVGV